MDRDSTVVTGQGQGSGWNRDIVQETNVIAPRDLVRWGPIWAGLLTALGLFLLLSMLALAIGLNNVTVGAGEADEAAAGSGIVSAIIALVSFAIGGFIASRSAAVGGSGAGALNGFLVWALGLLLILVLAAFGLGQLFGAAGDLFGQVRGTGIGTDVNAADVQRRVRDAAIPALLGLALPAAAATIGGFLGARRDRWANETPAETAR